MNSKWLKAGVALIAAISIGGGGVTATALAVDPVNAETVARSTSHVITDIGDIHIKSLTDGNTGKPFNGVLPDGTEVSDGVNADSQGISYILTVNGTIDDVGQLHEGDTVTWTVQPTANSHFRLSGMSGPEQLTGGDGKPVFTILYSGNKTILTRTATPAMGRYDFTLQYGKKSDYRFYGSRESTFSTTSGITIGDETITFANDPIQVTPATDEFSTVAGKCGLTSVGSVFEMRFKHGGKVNKVLNGEPSSMDDDPVIGYARITPTQGEIKGISFNSLWSRWGLAYDATHAGNGGDDFLHLNLAGKHVDRHITSWDEAKTLKPGEYTMTRNADGSYDVAVNLGSEQGDNALLSDEPSSWDEQTNNIVRKAIAEKTAGQWMSMRWNLAYADQYIVNKATATGILRKSTATKGGAFNMQLYNTVGSQAGAGQSSIIYNGNGATEGSMGMQVGDPDTNATIQANKYKRQGYKFTGWNTKPDGTGTAYTEGQTVTMPKEGQSLNLYAQWKALPVTISYNGNGGKGTVAGETVVAGTDVDTKPNGFTRVGYTFKGWNTKADGSGTPYQPGADIRLDGNVTLYAMWEANPYKVAYAPNGGKGTMPEQTFAYDQTQPLDGNLFDRDGWTFTGWNTEKDGSGTAYADRQEVTNLTTENGGKVTLYAQWKADKAALHYDANADTATGDTPESEGVTGDAVTVNENGYANVGYTFTGWNTKPDGTGTSIDPGDKYTLPAGDTTVYAQWKANSYTVAFDANKGAGAMGEQTFQYDVKQALSGNMFTRDGYTFTGWNTKPDGSSTAYTDKQEVVNLTAQNGGKVTLYAQWKAAPSQLAYDANSDTATGETTATSGVTDQTVNAADNGYENQGYTFTGWNTMPDGTGSTIQPGDAVKLPAGGMTVYAQWTRIPGTVSWVKTDAQSGDILTGSEWRLDGPDGQSVTVTDNGETDTDPDDGGFIVTGLDWGDWTLTETKAPEGHDPIPAPLTFTIDAQHTTISLGDVENTRTPATVTYDANGGTGTTAPYEGVVGDTPQAAANGFTASGDCDAFGGWNTKPDGSGTSYKEGDMLPPLTGDLTLYAQWDESNCKAEGLAQTGISTTTTIFAAVLFTFVSTILAAFSRLLRRRS